MRSVLFASCRRGYRSVRSRLLVGLLVSGLWASADTARATDSPVGTDPTVDRLATLIDLDGHFPFQVPPSLEAWQDRAEQLRWQLRLHLGLEPWPQLAPMNPTIHGRIEMDGYSVEKVYFESLPGLMVTGNLYRPLGLVSPKSRPAILAPHGHWPEARFYRESDSGVRRALATGGERFESSALNFIQARCVQLARMGCVVFHWDMIGYCDSLQLDMVRGHSFARPADDELSSLESWSLYSSQAEGYGQSLMGLQTLHSLRSVDFVLSLPEVDPERIAISGASGGGTQSFVAAALDPRIAVAFPAVMVSTEMQGGCVCENCCGLRVFSGNIELAALIAPRPLGLTTADDWTRNMARDGFPELKQLYGLFGEPDRVQLFRGEQFPHNFNHLSRVALYGWVNRHFGLGQPEPVLERDFELLGRDQLSVWNDEHPAPSQRGLAFERQLLADWQADIQRQLAPPGKMVAGDARQWERWRARLQSAWTGLLATAQPVAEQVRCQTLISARSELPDWQLLSPGGLPVGQLHWAPPAGGPMLGSPPAPQTVDRLRIVLSGAAGQSPPAAAQLVASVPAADRRPEERWGWLHVQDPLLDWDPVAGLWRQRLVRNPRLSAAYTYGYNPPHLVRCLGIALAATRQVLDEHPDVELELIGAGPNAWLAAALKRLLDDSGRRVRLRLVDSGWRLADADRIDHPALLPGGLRWLDLPGLVAAAADSDDLLAFPSSGQNARDWSWLDDLPSPPRRQTLQPE